VNPKNNPQQKEKEQSAPPLRQAIIIALIILVVGSLFFFFNSGRNLVQESSLPEIVSAIETGRVKTLTVRGDFLIAETTDGVNLGARKESNISTVEALSLLGTSPEALKTLPIVVQDPGTGLATIFGLLLTFAPLLLIGYLFFRFSRQMQAGGGIFNLPGRMGRKR
jgi:ATP-dependent Zn protease